MLEAARARAGCTLLRLDAGVLRESGSAANHPYWRDGSGPMITRELRPRSQVFLKKVEHASCRILCDGLVVVVDNTVAALIDL